MKTLKPKKTRGRHNAHAVKIGNGKRHKKIRNRNKISAAEDFANFRPR